MPHAEREARFREQTSCERPGRPTTGLVAFDGDEAVGWVAVEPRSAYVRLVRGRLPWAGREEDPEDASVWAIVCFVVRDGHRGTGIGAELARAAVAYARKHGARAVEGYPRHRAEGRAQSAADFYVGSPGMFAEAGMREVSRPNPRRSVMRVDFG